MEIFNTCIVVAAVIGISTISIFNLFACTECSQKGVVKNPEDFRQDHIAQEAKVRDRIDSLTDSLETPLLFIINIQVPGSAGDPPLSIVCYFAVPFDLLSSGR